MPSQFCGRTAPVSQSSTNEADNNTGFVDGQTSKSVSGHEGCDHAQLRLLIEPITNTYQVYCTTCFVQGPTCSNQTLAVGAFLAAAVNRHFARTESYAHAAALAGCAGYWGPDTRRYSPAELLALGLGS
jgi:hypothetical protein